MNIKNRIAIILFRLGILPRMATWSNGDFIACGYGKLKAYIWGDAFEYELPENIGQAYVKQYNEIRKV